MSRRDEEWAELRTVMLTIYGLYAAALPTFGVTLLVGAVLAFVKREELGGSPYADHLEYLLRTLIGAVVGVVIVFVFSRILSSYLSLFMYVAWGVFAVLVLWYAYRVGIGAYRLWRHQSVSPSGWM